MNLAKMINQSRVSFLKFLVNVVPRGLQAMHASSPSFIGDYRCPCCSSGWIALAGKDQFDSSKGWLLGLFCFDCEHEWEQRVSSYTRLCHLQKQAHVNALLQDVRAGGYREDHERDQLFDLSPLTESEIDEFAQALTDNQLLPEDF